MLCGGARSRRAAATWQRSRPASAQRRRRRPGRNNAFFTSSSCIVAHLLVGRRQRPPTWKSGSISKKSSMVFLQSLYAGHSRSALGSFLHCTWYALTCKLGRAGGRAGGRSLIRDGAGWC
jgi:hypothetical protein